MAGKTNSKSMWEIGGFMLTHELANGTHTISLNSQPMSADEAAQLAQALGEAARLGGYKATRGPRQPKEADKA